MAGIGFALERLTRRGGFIGTLEAYGYAALLSSGPWLITVALVAALWWFAPPGVGAHEQALFRVTLTHIYMLTLVSTGPLQMVVSRYLADRLWVRDVGVIAPAFSTGFLLLASTHALLGAALAYVLQFPSGFAIAAVSLFVVVACIWHAISVLSAGKEYRSIAFAFGVGAVVSFLAAQQLGPSFEAAGMVYGFGIGQALTLALLTNRIYAEFGAGNAVFDRNLLNAVWRYRDLAVTGFLYYAGLWIDKVVFAYGSQGLEVGYRLRSHPAYESAVFLAYLTVIPTLALFLIRIETAFYSAYRGFFAAILERCCIEEIEARGQEILDRFYLSVGRVVRLQAALSALVIVFAPQLLEALDYGPGQVQLFRIAALAAMLQAFLLLVLVGLLYVEKRAAALATSALFVLANGMFSLLSLRAGEPWHGYGYLAACLLALVVGYLILEQAVRLLVRDTFLRQPLWPEAKRPE